MKRKIGYFCMLIFVGIFYFFCVGDSGYIIERDSMSFLQANEFISQNYFVYVGFLKLCQLIFGSELQLYMVYVLQSIFAWIVSVIVTEYFRKKFELKYIEAFGVFVCTLLPYGYSLPENVATHYILTEGLSFSFFHLFLLFSIIVFLEKKIYMMIPTGIMTLILMFTRSQLILILVIYMGMWAIIALQNLYIKMNKGKHIKYWIVLGIITFIVCTLVPTIMVEIVKSGKLVQFTAAVSGRVFCVVEEGDGEYLDEEYRELFDIIYEEIDEREQREPYFRNNLWRWEDIANSTNENTKMLPQIISEYCSIKDNDLGNHEEILSYMTVALMKYHMVDYFEMTIVLCIQSLVVSVFIQPAKIYTLCWIITFVIYGCAMASLLYSIKIKCDSKYKIPILITGLALLGNVIITNLFFYGQQRYVVYCFGYFYISLFLLIKGIRYKSLFQKL